MCSKCTGYLSAFDSWEEKQAAVNKAYAKYGNMQFKCSLCKNDLDQPGTPLPSDDPKYLICFPCHHWIDMFGGIEEKRASVNEAYAARCAE